MAAKNGYMQQYAMLFGTYMGLFWILKFALIPIGMTNSFLLFLFICLTVGVPFMGYYFTKRYREQACGGQLTFMHAWGFNFIMFTCASLLTSVGHYLYFGFIDHEFLLQVCEDTLQVFKNSSVSGIEAYLTQMETNLDFLRSFTPIDITFQMLLNNVYNGVLLSILIAFVARKKKPAPDAKV